MNLRPARIEDKEAILNLVKKLARYERKKPDEVKLTIDKIESHGFARPKYFDILVAEDSQKLIGYALYFFSYAASAGAPILYLEDLFIEDEHRHQGLGKALLSHLAKLAIENKCCRMEWHAFAWNKKALQFYKNLGAIPKPDLIQFRLFGEPLNKLAIEKTASESLADLPRSKL